MNGVNVTPLARDGDPACRRRPVESLGFAVPLHLRSLDGDVRPTRGPPQFSSAAMLGGLTKTPDTAIKLD